MLPKETRFTNVLFNTKVIQRHRIIIGYCSVCYYVDPEILAKIVKTSKTVTEKSKSGFMLESVSFHFSLYLPLLLNLSCKIRMLPVARNIQNRLSPGSDLEEYDTFPLI